jgi:hypothetical protein
VFFLENTLNYDLHFKNEDISEGLGKDDVAIFAALCGK